MPAPGRLLLPKLASHPARCAIQVSSRCCFSTLPKGLKPQHRRHHPIFHLWKRFRRKSKKSALSQAPSMPSGAIRSFRSCHCMPPPRYRKLSFPEDLLRERFPFAIWRPSWLGPPVPGLRSTAVMRLRIFPASHRPWSPSLRLPHRSSLRQILPQPEKPFRSFPEKMEQGCPQDPIFPQNPYPLCKRFLQEARRSSRCRMRYLPPRPPVFLRSSQASTLR